METFTSASLKPKTSCWTCLFQICCATLSIAIIVVTVLVFDAVLKNGNERGDELFRGDIFATSIVCIVLMMFSICSYLMALIGGWNAVNGRQQMRDAYTVLFIMKLIFGNYLLCAYFMRLSTTKRQTTIVVMPPPFDNDSWLSLETLINTGPLIAMTLGAIELYLFSSTSRRVKSAEKSPVVIASANPSVLPSHWTTKWDANLVQTSKSFRIQNMTY